MFRKNIICLPVIWIAFLSIVVFGFESKVLSAQSDKDESSESVDTSFVKISVDGIKEHDFELNSESKLDSDSDVSITISSSDVKSGKSKSVEGIKYEFEICLDELCEWIDKNGRVFDESDFVTSNESSDNKIDFNKVKSILKVDDLLDVYLMLHAHMLTFRKNKHIQLVVKAINTKKEEKYRSRSLLRSICEWINKHGRVPETSDFSTMPVEGKEGISYMSVVTRLSVSNILQMLKRIKKYILEENIFTDNLTLIQESIENLESKDELDQTHLSSEDKDGVMIKCSEIMK